MSFGSAYNISARLSYLEAQLKTYAPYFPTTLASVLSYGNNAGATSIDMNNQDILNADNIQGEYIGPKYLLFEDVNTTNVYNGTSLFNQNNILTLRSSSLVGGGATAFLFSLKNSTDVDINSLEITSTGIRMLGATTLTNNFLSRQLSLQDITGASNGTAMFTSGGTLTIDSVGTAGTSSIITFATRSSATGNGTPIYPLQLTPTVINGLVSLDMVAPNAPTAPVWNNAIIRSRVYGFRDINDGTLVSSALYHTNDNSSFDILNIDCWGPSTPIRDGAIYMRTYSTTAGTLVLPLLINKDHLKTSTVLPANDNSNSIPTTNWVTNKINATVSPSSIRRASAAVSNVQGDYQFGINISGTWTQNQIVTFRLNYFQTFNSSGTSPFQSQNYISYSSTLTLYPFRFTTNWLNSVVNGVPRGQVNNNSIDIGSSGFPSYQTQWNLVNATHCPSGRQFWASDINFTAEGSPNGRLYIFGGPTIGQVYFLLSVPNGYATNNTYSSNFSIELLNQSNLNSTITSFTNLWNISSL